MPSSYLVLFDINQWFGDFHALKDVSLEVNEGELVCFLGPSGCGKTSLLRVIAGLDLQTSGTLHQAGRDISRLPIKARDFGIVFQSYALFPNLNVADNIAYGLRQQPLTAKKRKVRVSELLELVGLSGSERKYPAQLSGGQQQRVALSRALATEPGLLLLDEPLSALDARVRAHLRSEIKELQARLGVTTIMVTHDQEEALTMADRIVVMNHGCIEQVGTPQEVYAQPDSAFVADFVGNMNFLPGTRVNAETVNFNGHHIRCESTASFAEQDSVQLAIRPEDVHFRTNGHNVLRGTVHQLEFLGSFVRARLLIEGVDRPVCADVSMNEMQDLGLKQGKTVSFTLPPDRLHLFESRRQGTC